MYLCPIPNLYLYIIYCTMDFSLLRFSFQNKHEYNNLNNSLYIIHTYIPSYLYSLHF